MPEYTLQIISGIQVGRKIKVDGPLTLGRASQNGVCFAGPDASLVSSQHASLSIENGRLMLRDLGSTNGTYVNGEPVQEVVLGANAIVSLGSNGPKLRVLSPGGEGSTAAATWKSVAAADASAFSQAGRNLPSPGFPPATEDEAGNYTIGLAQRLSNDEADHREIQDLIKDQKRAQRLIHAGVLNQREAKMIEHAASTYSKGRKRALFAIAAVGGVGLVFTGVLLVQNLGYRGKLHKQENLMENIHELETQLAAASSDNQGAANQESDQEKALLVAKLRASERQLMEVRSQLNSRDLMNTYKDPMGREIHDIMQGFGTRDYIVPDIFIAQVEKHIYAFTQTSTRQILERSFANEARYQQMIETELLNAKMPTAFLYLAMHESMLDSSITSAAGARGLWQLMPQTARDYGLKVPDNWRDLPPEADERTNPLLSTRAAIKYLKTLYAEFGDVALAMAAYNAGEGRIRAALRSIDDPVNHRDFWYIYHMGILAGETNEYVPKIIATMIIDKNRARYHFPPAAS